MALNAPSSSEAASKSTRACTARLRRPPGLTYGKKDQQVTHTHTHTPTENNTPDTDTHAHDKNNTPNPQTNTYHKHLTTLEGGATTVRATSHTHPASPMVKEEKQITHTNTRQEQHHTTHDKNNTTI